MPVVNVYRNNRTGKPFLSADNVTGEFKKYLEDNNITVICGYVRATVTETIAHEVENRFMM